MDEKRPQPQVAEPYEAPSVVELEVPLGTVETAPGQNQVGGSND